MTDPAASLKRLSSAITPIAWTTPHDLRSHEQALAEWLAGDHTRVYDRPFEFPSFDLDEIHHLAAQARAACPGVPDVIRDHVEAHVEAQVRAAEVIHARDDQALADWAVTTRGLPTPDALAEASRTVATTPVPADPAATTIDGTEVQRRMEAALTAYGLTDWHVEVTPNMSANAAVNGRKRRVSIRGTTVTSRELDRLVVHEVGGHVLRWANAAVQPFEWATFPFGDSVLTEEGLAAHLEEDLGVSQDTNLRTYAVRALAVAAGQTLRLEELALHLTQYLDNTDAARLTLRLRRGFCHAASLGCRTKDHGYWTGLIACRDLTEDDVDLLRATKWPVEMLDLSRRLTTQGVLHRPTHTPHKDWLIPS